MIKPLGGNVLDISDEEDGEQTYAITGVEPKTGTNKCYVIHLHIKFKMISVKLLQFPIPDYYY